MFCALDSKILFVRIVSFKRSEAFIAESMPNIRFP